jgi:hypothetical protein
VDDEFKGLMLLKVETQTAVPMGHGYLGLGTNE